LSALGYRSQTLCAKVRKARFGGQLLDCPVYQRERSMWAFHSPAPQLLTSSIARGVIGPGQTATVDAYKNIIVGTGAAPR